MARRKKADRSNEPRLVNRQSVPAIESVERPLKVAMILSGVLLGVGVVMFCLGGGVAVGRIADGWGFAMSAVPNWGKPWGLVLMAAAAAYVLGPISLFRNPERGSIVMTIISGLSVLIGTPLITTTTEIFYNLFQTTKSRPDWVDSVWGYFTILNIAIVVALYRAYPTTEKAPEGAGAQ